MIVIIKNNCSGLLRDLLVHLEVQGELGIVPFCLVVLACLVLSVYCCWSVLLLVDCCLLLLVCIVCLVVECLVGLVVISVCLFGVSLA